ncbi:MAG: response regulator [Ferruginibacter sp.]
MEFASINLLLADDDEDDCQFFKEALEVLPFKSTINVVNDGEQLMRLLSAENTILPDILFLDLNMPRKSGYECLAAIKLIDKLKTLPVVVYSTSIGNDILNLLNDVGANFYIQKPGNFSDLKTLILEAIVLVTQKKTPQTLNETFVIQLKK